MKIKIIIEKTRDLSIIIFHLPVSIGDYFIFDKKIPVHLFLLFNYIYHCAYRMPFVTK